MGPLLLRLGLWRGVAWSPVSGGCLGGPRLGSGRVEPGPSVSQRRGHTGRRRSRRSFRTGGGGDEGFDVALGFSISLLSSLDSALASSFVTLPDPVADLEALG